MVAAYTGHGVKVARYRLRFLLQEFDLPRGATLIGRSSDCHVTIEDPLVSRQHARIVIDDDGAKCEDLGSRNGVKINGVVARGFTPLKDGDRLRIGTQELVFCAVGVAAQPPPAKTTGFLRYCASCRLPYPQELAACPACGATEQVDEETINGPLGVASQNAWGTQLLIEVMEKALRVGRVADAVRVVQRAKTQIEENLPSGVTVESEQIHALAMATLRVALAAKEPAWACWIAHLYGQARATPNDAVLALFAEVANAHPNELGPSLSDLLALLREKVGVEQGSSERELERQAIARIETLLKAISDLEDLASPSNDFDGQDETNPQIIS